MGNAVNWPDSLDSLRVGHGFGAHYRIETIVSKSEARVVVAATHALTNRLVTIRISRLNTSDEGLARHERALRAFGVLENEHFAAVLEVGRHPGGYVYVVYEYLDGVPLASWLRERGPLSIAAAAELMLQVSEALSGAHARGLLRVDLTLESLLATRGPDGDAFIKILPSDLAPFEAADSPTDSLTGGGDLGTLAYYAPEQYRGRRYIDARSEVWTVGVIFYELITGVPPFGSGSAMETVSKIFDGAYRPLRDLLPDLPEGLEEVVRKSLAVEPAQRFQSTAELADALEGYAEPSTYPLGAQSQKPRKLPRVDEHVQVSVYRPAVIAPERWFPLLAYVHLGGKRSDDPPDAPDPVQEVERRAHAVLGERMSDYRPTTQVGATGLAEGGQVTLVPEVDGLVFDPPSRSFFWRDRVHEASFGLKLAAAAHAPGAVIRGRLTVYAGIVLLADVQLSFTVGERASERATVSRASAYRKVFASYSHQDSAIVEQFAAHAEALGDEYLIDVRKLRSGEDWSARLEQFIRDADVFQLFWSSTSMRSRACRKEWEYALGIAKHDFVRPVFWEEPMPEDAVNGLPPPELARIHFARLPRKFVPRRRARKRVLPTITPTERPVALGLRSALESEAGRSAAPTRRRRSPLVLTLTAAWALVLAGVAWSALGGRHGPEPAVPVAIAPPEPSPTLVAPPNSVASPESGLLGAVPSEPPRTVRSASPGVTKHCYVELRSRRISSQPRCGARESPHTVPADAAAERAARGQKCTEVTGYRCDLADLF